MLGIDALLAPNVRIYSLPHHERPRLYFSGSTPLQRWHQSALYPAFKRSARLYRVLLRCKAALAVGASETNRAPAWVARDFVADCIPDLRSSVVLVGTPGPAQKITVQLWNDRGVAGYLKYGETPAARRRLENERTVLAALPESLGPALLKYGPMGNGVALLLSPVSGRALAPKLPPEKRLADFFQPASASQTASVADHPWFASLRASCGRRVDRWLDGLTGRKWPITLQHGDAAPWNMITTSRQSLCAIDWEYGSLKGVPYLDLAYYVLQVALLVYRWAPRHARDFAIGCLCRNSAPALSRAEAEALARLAACHAYVQSRDDGHPNDAPYQIWRRAAWEQDA